MLHARSWSKYCPAGTAAVSPSNLWAVSGGMAVTRAMWPAHGPNPISNIIGSRAG